MVDESYTFQPQADLAPEDKPSILYFDSMHEPDDLNLDILRQYVELEFIEKKAAPE